MPVSIPQRKGDPIVVDTDEGVRPGTTAESLGSAEARLRQADGTITAGNASQISDGGAAVMVVSAAEAESLGITPLGEVVGLRPGRRSGRLVAAPAVTGRQAGSRQGRARGRRRQPLRDQRGLRRRRARIHGRPRHHRRHHQRERRRHRPRSPHRDVRHAPRHHAAQRAAPAWRRPALPLCGGGGQGDAILVETI